MHKVDYFVEGTLEDLYGSVYNFSLDAETPPTLAKINI